MQTDKNLLSIILIAVLLAAGLFALDWRTGSHAQTTLIVLTVTPPAQTVNPPTTLDSVSSALPSFADFLKSGGVAEAAPLPQAAPLPGPSVTGWLDPSLGKVIIVDGVNHKMRCEGLEGNQDFAKLTPAQQVIAKDTCSQL